MRVKSFEVSGLHGLIDAAIDFHPDLTVIVGRNGSGKTSILELVSNLLRLDIEAIRGTVFTGATLRLDDPNFPNSEIRISTTYGVRSLVLTVGSLDKVEIPIDAPARGEGLLWSTSEQPFTITADPGNPPIIPFGRLFPEPPWSGPAKALSQNTHLTFVRLDRTIVAIDSEGAESIDQGLPARKSRAARTSTVSRDPVDDVVAVTRRKYLEYRRKIGMIQQLALIELLGLHFAPIDPKLTAKPPTESVLREQLARLKKQVQGSKLVADRPSLGKKADHFFTTFQDLLEAAIGHATKRAGVGRRTIKEETLEILLKSKQEQIQSLLSIFEREQTESANAFANIERFLVEVRRFLAESGKNVDFSQDTYELGFTVPTAPKAKGPADSEGVTVRPLKELSSGERQVMILLTFLAFRAGNNSIFVIDEPELSLHIRWQSYLIDALQNLRPNDCQIIIATHAPEIAGRAQEFARILKPSYLPDGDTSVDQVQ